MTLTFDACMTTGEIQKVADAGYAIKPSEDQEGLPEGMIRVLISLPSKCARPLVGLENHQPLFVLRYPGNHLRRQSRGSDTAVFYDEVGVERVSRYFDEGSIHDLDLVRVSIIEDEVIPLREHLDRKKTP